MFSRALNNLDIATGKIDILVNRTYSSTGLSNIDGITNVDPGFPEPTCYVLEPYSCDEDSWNLVASGKGVIKNYILQRNSNGNSTTPNGTVSILPMPSPSHSIASTHLVVGWIVGIAMGAAAFVIHFM